jgi:hypothetical protein
MGIELRPPERFSKNGYRFVLIKTDNKIAMYEQRSKDRPNIISAYEIHKLRMWPKPSVSAKVKVEGVRLPSNEDWGTFGWTYTSKERALEKYMEIGGS